MKLKKLVIMASLTAFVITMAVFTCATAEDQKAFKWRMQTYAVPGTVGFQSQQIALDSLKAATNGRLEIKLYGVGTLVRASDQLEACGKGLFEVMHNPDAYAAGLDAGFAPIFSAIALWDDPRQVRVWIESFGGKEIMEKAYAKYGVKYLGSTLIGAEPIMSTKPLEKLEDFKGIKIRTPSGMTSMLFDKLGAAPVSLPGGEIYSALDTKVIDAAEFVTLSEDVGAGFHEVTKYVLYPSFHGPIAVVNYGVNQKAWDKLPDDLKAAFKMMVYEADYLYDIMSAAADYKALQEIKAKGLTVTKLSAEDMAKARELSLEVAQEYKKKSPLAEEVIDSIVSFLQQTGQLPADNKQ